MFDTFEKIQHGARAYWGIRVLLTAAELDLFTALAAGPRTVAEVAGTCGTDERATRILLDALVSLGLLVKQGDTWWASAVAARHLAAGSPEPALGMLLHQAELWRRWSQLTEVVRTGRPAPRGDDAPAKHESFIRAMHEMKLGEDLSYLLPVDLSGVDRAIDLGGGPGTLAMALLRSRPGAVVTLLDRPATLDVAARVVPPDLWGTRIVPLAADLLERPYYGEGYDLAILSAVLHAMGEGDCARVVQRAAACLRPGGQLLVREFILEDDRAGPPRAALFSVNMLVGTPAGRSYTFPEMAAWMRDAGLVDVHRTPDDRADAVVGTRPA